MTNWTSGLYTIIPHHSGNGWTFRNERNPKHTRNHVPRESMYAVALYLRDKMHVPWQNIVWPVGHGEDACENQDSSC